MKQFKPTHKPAAWQAALAALLLGGTMADSHAATSVNLTANDGGSPGSYATVGNWSDAQAPHAGANYYTGTYLLRSTYNGSATFWVPHSTRSPSTSWAAPSSH